MAQDLIDFIFFFSQDKVRWRGGEVWTVMRAHVRSKE